jgi:hypothetical protein
MLHTFAICPHRSDTATRGASLFVSPLGVVSSVLDDGPGDGDRSTRGVASSHEMPLDCTRVSADRVSSLSRGSEFADALALDRSKDQLALLCVSDGIVGPHMLKPMREKGEQIGTVLR